jgi:hypothetical protein
MHGQILCANNEGHHKTNHLEVEIPFQNYWSFIPQKLVFYVHGSEVFISNNVYH